MLGQMFFLSKCISMFFFLSIVLLGEAHAQTTTEKPSEEGESKPLQIENYKPMYFIMGSPNTKIELSFKIKLVEAGNLYFGYTQLMFWELFQKDAFFHDLNYIPELFYRLYLNSDTHEWL